MKVTTGFGFFKDSSGLKLHKYGLPIGDHSDPANGLIQVEVENQEILDAIVLDQTPEQIANTTALNLLSQIKNNREAYMDALINNDLVTQQAIVTAQASLITQAIGVNATLPEQTKTFINNANAVAVSASKVKVL